MIHKTSYDAISTKFHKTPYELGTFKVKDVSVSDATKNIRFMVNKRYTNKYIFICDWLWKGKTKETS